MTAEIDEESLTELRKLHGQTVRQISGLRYPGVAGYSEVQVSTTKQTFVISLRIHDVTSELEVCVPVVKSSDRIDAPAHADTFDVAGFRVTEIEKLQRRESLEWLAGESGGYIGSEPREQQFLEVDPDDEVGIDLVDAGIALVSSGTVILELYADTFPLVYQLRFTIAGTALPRPRRVRIE